MLPEAGTSEAPHPFAENRMKLWEDGVGRVAELRVEPGLGVSHPCLSTEALEQTAWVSRVTLAQVHFLRAWLG